MSGTKISSLTDGGSVTQNDEIPVARGTTGTYKVAAQQFVTAGKNLGNGNTIFNGVTSVGTGGLPNTTMYYKTIVANNGLTINTTSDNTTLVISGSAQSPIKTVFIGDGITTIWALNNTNSTNACNHRVTIDGTVQEPIIDNTGGDYYINSNGIVFTTPPPIASRVVVISNNLTVIPEVPDYSITSNKLAAGTIPLSAFTLDNGSFSFRNKIINGDFRVDQRLGGTSIILNNQDIYTVDRWTAYSFNKDANVVTPIYTSSSLPVIAQQRYYSFVFGGGKFVTLGDQGYGAYSTDAVTWYLTPLPIRLVGGKLEGKSYPNYGLAYGNGTFVAFGGSYVASTPNIGLYSTDGITWNQTKLPIDFYIGDATYGNGKFVAIGSNAQGTSNIGLYSTDGITWNQTTLPYNATWSSITYGNGKFVAVASGIGSLHTDRAAYSTDGITWTASTLPTIAFWSSVTYGSNLGVFVAVAYAALGQLNSSTNIAAYSTDGITWNQTTLPANKYWIDVTYGNGRYVAIAVNGASNKTNTTNAFAYSNDGITWYESNTFSTPSGQAWDAVVYGNGKFVALHQVPPGNTILTVNSTDGITWLTSGVPYATYYNPLIIGSGTSVLSGFHYDFYKGYFNDNIGYLNTASKISNVTSFNSISSILGCTYDGKPADGEYVDPEWPWPEELEYSGEGKEGGNLPVVANLSGAFTAVTQGFFYASVSGDYNFKLGSSDAAYFWFNTPLSGATTGNKTISLPGVHDLTYQTKYVTVSSSGFYPIAIVSGSAGNKGSSWILDLQYKTPSVTTWSRVGISKNTCVYYTASSTVVNAYNAGVASVQRVADSNLDFTNAPPGYYYSLRFKVEVAKPILQSSDLFGIRQRIEGINILDLCYGTAQARPATLSFWVKSSVAGKYALTARNHYNNPFQITGQYTTTYTIKQANIWQYVSLTIPPNYYQVNNKNQYSGLGLLWCISAGSDNYNYNLNTWTSNNQNNLNLTIGSVDSDNTFMATAGNEFKITGVQLEVGPTPTPFEIRPAQIELALCQRYFESSYDIDVAPGSANAETAAWAYVPVQNSYYNIIERYKVTKRAIPNVQWYDPKTGTKGGVRSTNKDTVYYTSDKNRIGLEGQSVQGFTLQLDIPLSVQDIYTCWTADAEI